LESDERIILMEIHLLFSTILLSLFGYLCGSLPLDWNRRYQELWLDRKKSE